MKKILIVLAVLASFQVANAQNNSEALTKEIEKAQTLTQNPKKAANPASWLTLAKAYVAAYNAPTGNIIPGISKTELALTMAKEKPQSSENVTINGQQYTKDVYADKNLYISPSGQLDIVEVTKPVVKDALSKALEAYQQAFSCDTKGKKTQEISEGIKQIATYFANDAANAYRLSDLKKSKELFANAVDASMTKPYEKLDTASLSNAGLVSFMDKDYASAQKYYEKCVENKFYGDNGGIYARLADCAMALDTTAAGKAKAKGYLEQGFEKFPQSEENLYGLINYYSASGESEDQLFALIDKAKAKSPDNASIYYVEGNAYAKLNKFDEALAAYRQAQKVDPKFNWGFIGEGSLYTGKADKLVAEAQQTLDDAKYTALVNQYYDAMKSAIDVYEKAYDLTTDESLKPTLGDILKTLYYRLREQDPKYQAGYEKYLAIYK